jgi:hypothetical protein
MIRTALLVLAVAALALETSAQAPASSLARTKDGKPDLQGNWSTAWITPPEANQLVVPASEQAKLFEALRSRLGGNNPLNGNINVDMLDVTGLLIVGGEARSSLIVDPPDGKLPFTEAARPRRPAAGPVAQGLDDPEQRPLGERCIIRANLTAPLVILPAGNIKQIVQTADHFVILSETFSVLRIIPLDAANGLPGAGRGHWDGDVFVVETTGFAPADRVRRGSFGQFSVSPKSRITERFTRTGPDEILYAFTVEDADLYTRPWTAEFALKRSDAKLYEWGCHEGNYSFANILRGARIMEQRAGSR